MVNITKTHLGASLHLQRQGWEAGGAARRRGRRRPRAVVVAGGGGGAARPEEGSIQVERKKKKQIKRGGSRNSLPLAAPVFKSFTYMLLRKLSVTHMPQKVPRYLCVMHLKFIYLYAILDGFRDNGVKPAGEMTVLPPPLGPTNLPPPLLLPPAHSLSSPLPQPALAPLPPVLARWRYGGARA
jgi:hypothetical protein